ncbi:hypothetical protein MMC22_008647 [Lobaria immixta]|nr:hypothetical protein [Lobaria immixta]
MESATMNLAMYFPLPVIFVVQLRSNNQVLGSNDQMVFNFTDGTLVLANTFVTLIRISTQYPDYGDVLAADLCVLSYCAQRRNVSVSLNRLSSTILQTVYGTKVVHQFNSTKLSTEWLSFTGKNFNMTAPSQVNGTHSLDTFKSHWEYYLDHVIFSLQGNLTVNTNFPHDFYAISNIIATFNASSNMSMTMDNIATTLTNYYRDSSNVTVAGQAEFYIRVTWAWITLPAFFVIAGTVFLILAIFETKKLGARVWKTFKLALLFHGLEESDQELNELHRSSEMENVASRTKVKVVSTSGGKWILRREKMRTKSMQ